MQAFECPVFYLHLRLIHINYDETVRNSYGCQGDHTMKTSFLLLTCRAAAEFFLAVAVLLAPAWWACTSARADDYLGALRYVYQDPYAPIGRNNYRADYMVTYDSRAFSGSEAEQYLGVSYGAVHGVDLEVYGTASFTGATREQQMGGAELKYYLPVDAVNLGIVGDYHTNRNGDSITNLRLIVAKSFGRWNITVNGSTEHKFSGESDNLDAFFNAGASYFLNSYAAVGAEVQASDLEAFWIMDEADGGVSYIASPVLMLVSRDLGMQFLLGPGAETKDGRFGGIMRASITKSF